MDRQTENITFPKTTDADGKDELLITVHLLRVTFSATGHVLSRFLNRRKEEIQKDDDDLAESDRAVNC